MVTVQLRDVNDPERFLIDHIVLPFEPRLGVPMYLWDRMETPKNSFFNFSGKKKPRCFVPTEVLRYDISREDPAQSGIVYLAREVEPR